MTPSLFDHVYFRAATDPTSDPSKEWRDAIVMNVIGDPSDCIVDLVFRDWDGTLYLKYGVTRGGEFGQWEPTRP